MRDWLFQRIRSEVLRFQGNLIGVHLEDDERDAMLKLFQDARSEIIIRSKHPLPRES
jgi:hypothetical protein